MKYILLVYNDTEMLDAIPQAEYDASMRHCFEHADELQTQGKLLQSEQLEAPSTARTVRVRNGKVRAIDGPFAETKEVLGGFNIIEAENIDEAVRIALEFPWVRSGCIEVRPIRDINAERQRVGAMAGNQSAT
ncbi:MAG TPA: YciI family protein [Gemmatimonadaceae bacterium]